MNQLTKANKMGWPSNLMPERDGWDAYYKFYEHMGY